MKRLLLVTLASVLMVSSVVPALATEVPSAGAGQDISAEGSGQNTPVTLTAEPMQFSVTLPSSFPIAVDSTGQVFTADNAQIVNNSSADVQVTNLEIEASVGWSLSDYDTYSTQDGVMAMRIDSVKTTGSDTTNFTPSSFEPIAKSGGTADLPYDAKLPTFYDATSVQVADVIFTIGWSEQSVVPQAEYPVMQEYSTTSRTDFHAYKKDITEISIVDYQEVPDSSSLVHGPWDISQDQDGSIMAWMPTTTTVVISGNGSGGIRFNPVADYLFYSFHHVKNITGLDLIDTSEVTSMRGIFSSCQNLVSLDDIDGWDTSSVTNMSALFNYCAVLRDVPVGNWDVSSVTNINGMFGTCYNLTKLDLSKWDTSSIELASSVFFSCDNMTDLNLLNWDTSHITNMENMFNDMDSIQVLDLSSFDMSNVKLFGCMFTNSDKLTVCWGRTEEDCIKLNSSSSKPDNVNFVVKSA